MDPTQLTIRLASAVAFSAEEVEMLERLGVSLPVGWNYELDGTTRKWCFLSCEGRTSGKVPIIIIHKTPRHYTTTVCDEYDPLIHGHLPAGNCEHFHFKHIEDALTNLRHLVCEMMQTENPSEATPIGWMRCVKCEAVDMAACVWRNPGKSACHMPATPACSPSA